MRRKPKFEDPLMAEFELVVLGVAIEKVADRKPCASTRPWIHRWDDLLSGHRKWFGWCDTHGQKRSLCTEARDHAEG